jgi:hypothetical protein
VPDTRRTRSGNASTAVLTQSAIIVYTNV